VNLNPNVPVGVFWTSALLLFLGSVTLLGSLLPPRDAESIGVSVASILLITTAILILRNHKWALSFAFTSASLMTLGLAYEFIHHIPFTWQRVGRFILLVTMYWTAYLWYRKWRLAEEKQVV
jgi:hypothetical protein